MKKLTQAQRILRHLERGNKLTPKGAAGVFDCMRLAARIADLRNEGFDIKTTLI
ncbi:MAG: helix-turn-helix domain-containing protein, partial [Akkermansiaceae bacterium]